MVAAANNDNEEGDLVGDGFTEHMQKLQQRADEAEKEAGGVFDGIELDPEKLADQLL